MTPSDTAHPEGEMKIASCPFCGLRLERSEAFSNRTRNVYVHPQQPDEAYPCPAYDYRVADNDPQRLAAWNTRPVARPQGEEGLWRPISEAPRDGTFLAAYNDGTVVAAHYLDNSHTRHPFAGVRPLHGLEGPGRTLTHWQPLPAPPAISNQGKPSS